MTHKTGIQWTHIPGYIGATWNPLVGCRIKSPGCIRCYAMRDAYRKGFNPKLPRYHGLTEMTKAGPVWTGKTNEAPVAVVLRPLSWQKPHAVFVEDMSDLFFGDEDDRAHGNVGFSTDQIDRIFAVMAMCPQHIFLVLTKRAKRMREYLQSLGSTMAHVVTANDLVQMGHVRRGTNIQIAWPLPNVWLGVSTEDQTRADERIPHLLGAPAAKRFISAEPLIGPISLTNIKTSEPSEAGVYREVNALTGAEGHGGPCGSTVTGRVSNHLDWVIVGGESGSGARDHDLLWDRIVRGQCASASVAYFEKQFGLHPVDVDVEYVDGRPVATSSRPLKLVNKHGGDVAEWPEDLRVRQFPIHGADGEFISWMEAA